MSLYRKSSKYFNPRPREEGDFGLKQISNITRISIHALVKRATKDSRTACGVGIYFNPRPREEGDEKVDNLIEELKNFNPRPREEGDLQPVLGIWSLF